MHFYTIGWMMKSHSHSQINVGEGCRMFMPEALGFSSKNEMEAGVQCFWRNSPKGSATQRKDSIAGGMFPATVFVPFM